MPATDVRHAPVLVLQHLHLHLHEDGSTHLGQRLGVQGPPWQLRNAEAGDPCPDGLRGQSALAVLGGACGRRAPPASIRGASMDVSGRRRARVTAASAACAAQALVLGPHLAMPFPIEITAHKIEDWLAAPCEGKAPALDGHPQSVQSPTAMRADTPRCLPASQPGAGRPHRRALAAGLVRLSQPCIGRGRPSRSMAT